LLFLRIRKTIPVGTAFLLMVSLSSSSLFDRLSRAACIVRLTSLSFFGRRAGFSCFSNSFALLSGPFEFPRTFPRPFDSDLIPAFECVSPIGLVKSVLARRPKVGPAGPERESAPVVAQNQRHPGISDSLPFFSAPPVVKPRPLPGT